MKENDQIKNRKLGWVAYVAGKRESRRLMGGLYFEGRRYHEKRVS